MFRYALKIEYMGTYFHGWQRQENLETVQGAINFALKSLDPFCNGIIGAGRTDAGVHATGQVAHLDLKKNWDPNRLQHALNFYLKPKLIAIIGVAEVDSNFHSRFSAIKRHYLFKIMNRSAPLTLEKHRFWHVGRPLDIKKMEQAASYLIGKHDFTTFRSSLCQAKSPIKSIDLIKISKTNSSEGNTIEVKLEARSFLHNQVRSIVGTLEKVGSKVWPPERVKSALDSKNRSECGPVAPPSGLYLSRVDYPENIFCINNQY